MLGDVDDRVFALSHLNHVGGSAAQVANRDCLSSHMMTFFDAKARVNFAYMIVSSLPSGKRT